MRIQERIKGLALQMSDWPHFSGSGEVWLRQLMAYFTALIWNVDWYLKYVPVSDMHETDPNNKYYLNNDWLKIFNFLNDNQLNYQQKTSPLSLYITNTKYYSKEDIALIPWHNTLEIYDTQTYEQKRELIKHARKQFIKNCKYRPKKNFFSDDAFNIALHIRNLTIGDDVSVASGIDFQLFTHDYGTPDNNPTFYARFYAAMISQFIEENPQEKINLVIFSSGKYEDFSLLLGLLNKYEPKLVLNGYAPDDFYHLCTADLLIAAQSQFSFLAMFLNSNIKMIRKGYRYRNYLPFDALEIGYES